MARIFGSVARPINTPDGWMTRKQAAQHYGIAYNTLVRRLWKNWPIERAIQPATTKMRRDKYPPAGVQRYHTPWGYETTFQAAKRMGMTKEALDDRLRKRKWRRGQAWAQEEAFNTPPYGKRGVHFIIPPEEYRRRMGAREMEHATV